MTHSTRFYYIWASIFFIISGLLFSSTYTGLFISFVLACAAFRDEKLGIAYLLLFIPMRPFLVAFNPGLKFIGLFIIIALLVRLLRQYRNNISKLFSFRYFEILYFLFCLFGAGIGLLNGVSFIAIAMQLHTLLLFYFVYYITSRITIHHEDIVFFAKITFIASSIMAVQGLIEKLSLRTIVLPEAWKALVLAPTNKIRIYGMAGGPNELALYLTLAFLISLYVLQHVSGKMKYVTYTGLTLIATTLWLTYSRGAFLTVIVFMLIYLCIHRKIPIWRSLLIISLLSFLCATCISKMTNYLEGDQVGVKRFTEALSEDTVELSKQDGRIYYVKKAVEIFQDKPITGYGLGTFGDAATQTFSSPIYEKYEITWDFYSDNQYIQILAETGIIGVLLCAGFTLGFLSLLWKYRRKAPFAPLTLYLIVGAIIGSAFYNILENASFMMYFFLTAGYIQHATKKSY
ncbi:O-antigen ligase family protein [Bacillus sp. 123MFChir2]|uniref:O-antigen ligase family protein n=1 Tax=Bacillus sp. 123MFChir2 TaxID=1169144 RepID=UPI0003758499|nr:O-antigen ligase family protein [Bacillus sp. 123MFChir2]